MHDSLPDFSGGARRMVGGLLSFLTDTLQPAAGATLLAVAAFFIPMDVLAQDANTLKDVQGNVGENIQGLPRLIALGSYIVGTFFAVRALLALKGFLSAPDDNPVNKAIGFGAISAMLILLPYIISVMAYTIGVGDADIASSAAAFSSNFAGENPCADEESIYRIFCSLSWEFRFIPRLMALLCYVGGVALILMGLLNLRAYGDDPSSTPLRSVLMKFALGALLISVPLTMDVIVRSVSGGTQGVDSESEPLNRPAVMRGNSLNSLRGGN